MSDMLHLCVGDTPVKVGGRVPGGRLEKYYAQVEAIDLVALRVRVCYNGECRSFNLPAEAVGAHWKLNPQSIESQP